MAEVSQKTKYVKLDDGVSFSLVRTNPKLTTNTKLMYNGKKMYMESYASGELLNRTQYKNVYVRPNSTYNKDIANFLTGSGTQAYTVYQNLSDTIISSSYDNQFETMYWCGAEHIDSSFYSEEIGFIAPLYLREKLPNYFLIFRLDTPSNYNLNVDENGNILDSTFDFKKDILDKAVLIKTFDLREKSDSTLGKYIHNYIKQDEFEFDKSMYVNFSNGEVTYYGINKADGVLIKRVENFNNELLKTDNPVLEDDKWFTDGFERNNLIFPYIMNIEYLFDDENFKNKDGESCDFARYIGLYCNTIEFGEFSDFSEFSVTEDNVIYYFEDNKNNLHRYTKKIKSTNDGYDVDSSDGDDIDNTPEYEITIDGKDIELFDKNLITGFEKERVTGYAEPLDIYEGFINRAQYGFEILKPLEPGDWVGIEYKEKDENGKTIIHHVECYFADRAYNNENQSVKIGDYDGFRFFVGENSTVKDIAEALVKCVNNNRKSKFEARCSENVVAFYAKREGKKYNGSEDGGAKMLLESSLIYNGKISLPVSNDIHLVSENDEPIENISDSDDVIGDLDGTQSLFGDYYVDYFCGACDVDIDEKTDTYKNIFKIYTEEYMFFDINRYLKTNNGGGRRICSNMVYINAEGKIDPEYRLVIVDNVTDDNIGNSDCDISVSSTYQVEILDEFKPNHGVLSWFPVKDFDFDINYSSYGQYGAFVDECNSLSKILTYNKIYNTEDTYGDSDLYSNQEESIHELKKLAKSPFFDDYGNSLETEYDYYFEQFHPDLCLKSKTVPYISKWGYYDEQKDSCENPYRLNVNKVFGVSNLSANIYIQQGDEEEYTHNMPYYMTLNKPNYQKEYQYIESDEYYSIYNNTYVLFDDSDSEYSETDNKFNRFYDCVDYWIKMFMKTDEDMFSHFFSGKKYGKRFDKKYSRLLGGNKFNNPSTLFRGVKFEAVRQYNGIDKRSSEYNDYKFSFVYIPVFIKSMCFSSTINFVKNDTFKFIVGIIFVNTMLGEYNHNIFNGRVDYFNKGFLYAGCKDIIFAENTSAVEYYFYIKNEEDGLDVVKETGVKGEFWDDIYKDFIEKKIYMWISEDQDKSGNNTIFVTKTDTVKSVEDIIGEFKFNENQNDEYININNIKKLDEKLDDNIDNIIEYTTIDDKYDTKDENDVKRFKILWKQNFVEYDSTIYGYRIFKEHGFRYFDFYSQNIEIKNNNFIEICNNYDNEKNIKYTIDVSILRLKEETIRNILFKLNDKDSIVKIRIYDNKGVVDKTFINTKYKDEITSSSDSDSDTETTSYLSSDSEVYECDILIDKNFDIKIIKSKNENVPLPNNATTIVIGKNDVNIEDLLIDIIIKDKFNDSLTSIGLKDYFSVFNKISMFNITEYINNDYNVKYYSTVEDNKYKIRVIEPDSIEIEDVYEAIPMKILQNNKSVIGTINIMQKSNIDNIGIKNINRYSGFYNPIFNDILYYDDYSYIKHTKRMDYNVELPYSNTNIDYTYDDGYGKFGIIKNMYYHKTNVFKSNKILSIAPIYPAINEYALGYRDYNVFSSNWDEGYFMSQDDLNNASKCPGIGSMKEGLCMFGSKYLNIPDDIFIDTFENGKLFDDRIVFDIGEDMNSEILYKEINNRTVQYNLFIEKRLKRYLKDKLIGVFSKYINKDYSFGNKGTIEDDVEEYIEKNLLKLYKVDKVNMYVKGDRMKINDKKIENDYLKYVNKDNELKINNGFQSISIDGNLVLKDSKFTMGKVNTNEFDRTITYNLKPGFKESFGFSVSFKRK